MQRLLLLFILAIALLGGWFLLWPDNVAPEIHDSNSEFSQASSLQLKSDLPPAESLPPKAERSTRVEQAKAIQFHPWPQIDGPSITVEVWNREAQAPAPFATVFLESKYESFKDSRLRENLRAWLLENAEVYQTDETGRIQAPRSWLLRNTYAESKQGHWGGFRLQESEYRDTVRIDVVPVRNITIQVVDEDQTPVPNAIVHLASSQYSGMQPWLQATTNQAGKAVLKRVPYQIIGLHNINGYAILTGDPPSTGLPELVDLKDIPDEITVVMQPAAIATVQAFDLTGKLIDDLPSISVKLLGNSPSGKPWSDSPLFQTWVDDEEQGQTVVTLPANHPFELSIDFDECGEVEYFPFEGLKAGTNLDAKLQQRQFHPTIRFRLVDGNGETLGNKEIHPTLIAQYVDTRNAYSRRISLTTSEDGYGQFQLPHADLRAGNRTLNGRRLRLRLNAEDGGFIEGSLQLDQAFGPGTHDLGDLTLRSLSTHTPTRQIFATGYVEDADGEPLVGARIDAGAPVTTKDGVLHSTTGRSLLGRTEVDDDGYFILYGNRPKDWSAVTLRAIRIGYPWKRVPLLAPGQEHRIVLDAGNLIRGQVLLPLGMEQQGISLEFVPYSDADAKPHDPYSDSSATDGLFRLTELPAEAGILKVGLGMAWPFHPVTTIENVFPWKLGQEGDPRLALIDLRESLGVYQVTAVDENGVPLTNAVFRYVMRRPNGYTSRSIPNKNGTAIILAPDTEFEATVGATGYRPQDLSLSDPITIVELEPALAIHCQLSWMPPLANGRDVILSLSPVDGGSKQNLLSKIEFDSAGELQFFISRPGRFEVSLGIQVRHGWSADSLLDANGDAVTITVVETKETQSFYFDPPKGFYNPLLLPADRVPEKD